MPKKIQLEFTVPELNATIQMVDTMESMIGCDDGPFTEEQTKKIKLFDKMLSKNGFLRWKPTFSEPNENTNEKPADEKANEEPPE